MMRLKLLAVLLTSSPLLADPPREAAPKPRRTIDLTGYRTTRDAIRAEPKSFSLGDAARPLAYFGMALAETDGMVVIEEIDIGSPAEDAGLAPGDRISQLNGAAISSLSAARERLRTCLAGDAITLQVLRDAKAVECTLVGKPLSRPMGSNADAPRAVLGIQVTRGREGGIRVTSVTNGGGADRAGVKVDDVILKVDEAEVDSDAALREALSGKKDGDVVTLSLMRNGQEMELKATLAAETPARAGSAAWDDRLPSTFRKPVYRLAIVGVEYPDVKHSPTITEQDWENALFSRGTYTGRNATGQDVYGSVADYYKEVSYGQLTLEGKFIDWVEVSKKKMEYNLGSSTSSADKGKFFAEMMDRLVARHGPQVLKDYDGVFVIFAGERVATSRGGLYWPHRASFTHDRRRFSYFIVPELNRSRPGANPPSARMTDISVICHEFGHMLGLPDLYARPENPGSEGVGVWCAMSNQLPNGRPQHFSAWSKEQMGWLKPVLIDPRVKQKLILAPVQTSPNECFKIPVRADGSEYFLLENRVKRGWDANLPAEGLLIWRVLPNPGVRGTQQVFLEEAHGIAGPSGPRVLAGAVPFPSPGNHSFTPFTIPSSKSTLGGGLDVNITNIRRLPDGRVCFQVGYDYH